MITKCSKLFFTKFVLASPLLCIFFTESVASSVTNQDIQTFTEKILNEDNSGLSDLVRYNRQGKAQSTRDSASQPLLNVDGRALENPTVKALMALFDNYDPDVTHPEVVTHIEKLEESAFINAVMKTKVMQSTYEFLTEKGLFRGDQESFKHWLAQIWFSLYSRGFRERGSSAFEHVFLGEIKNHQVSGLHNWIYFNNQEKSGTLNYMGWKHYLDFGKGSLVKVHFTWNDVDKPVSSLFVGTSPELELALYSVCYLARPGNACQISLNRKPLVIISHTFQGPNSQKLIGSIYPEVLRRNSY
ncbi:poly(U)-specific endoribonuclease homolog [Nilaparvata lugens]|uniref:poly(U)-specific endoribonuclease homolog n=1 Tax=Nilaparvata lugens TaxID=108931 RepID=UPI000B987D2E|nr:poly(U)-specific endoribonuclease homolog [Nilaparvata lugens]